MSSPCRRPAGGNGRPTDVAERSSLTLESTIDLDGNPFPERLVADESTLVVSNGRPDKQRRWRLTHVDGFRVVPTIGSSFVQGRIGGHWVDLLRRPGTYDPSLTEAIDWLNRQRLAKSSIVTDGATSRFNQDDGVAAPPKPAKLLTILRPFVPSILLLLGLSAIVVGIQVVPPLLQRTLVDRVLTVDSVRHRPGELLLLLSAIVLGLLLVRVADTTITIGKAYISTRVGTAMTAGLREALVEKFNALPMAFHDRSQVGVLMSQVAYDTENLHTLIYHMTSGLLVQSLQLVGISVVLFYLNPKLAVLTLLPMPLIIAGGWYFTRYLEPRQHHYWAAVGKQASALMGMLAGMRVVKLFTQEGREISRFRRSSERLRNSRQTVDISTSTFTATMGLLFALGGLAVWYVGGRDVLNHRMTLGSLMAFLAYLAMFYAPLTSLAESTAWFANFFGTSRRIRDVLQIPDENAAPRSPLPLEAVSGRLDVEHLWFGYDKNRPVLKDVCFEVRPGETMGIVGRSGSGKSTLVSLLGRLYDPDSGQIRIDGRDLREIRHKDLRRQIGMVPQDPFLFRGSIAENISYGNVSASPEQVLQAAIEADAHDFIMDLPLGYSTQLRDGGSGLSGGQRQRLSIARALLFDPPILILDEATSNIDAESEIAISNTVRRWARRRTAIVISHRLSTLRMANRLLVFEEGQIVEQGTPQELLARDGIYRRLASLQGNLADLRHQLETATGTRVTDSRSPHEVEGNGPQRDATIPWLKSETTAIEGGDHGLCVRGECSSFNNVRAIRAFPTDDQGRYISLRCLEASGREREIGIIEDLRQWPAAAQQAVIAALKRHYLLRRIEHIRQIRTSENVLALSVVTDAGQAAIRLDRPGEGAQPFGSGGLLLTDPSGNYFVIPDRDALPKWQQRLLTLYFGD